MHVGERLSLVCADLDDEGAGVSADAVHVAGALPSEAVTATVEHVSPHRREAWARLERLDVPSPARRVPACAAFGSCGGCVLQHWDYPEQTAWKRRRVERALSAAAVGDLPVHPCVGSPRRLGYRNNSKLVAGRHGARLVLGAFAPRTHRLVNLAGCRIAEPPLDDTAEALRALFDDAGVEPYDEQTLSGGLRYVVLRTNARGEVLAVWIAASPLADGAGLARRFRAARPEVVGVVEHVNATRGNALYGGGALRLLDGASSLKEGVDIDGRAVALRLSAGAFFQANRDVAGLAYTALARALAPRAGERVVDAYCGVGGIALGLAGAVGPAGMVVGIENNRAAVEDARASADLNHLRNVQFQAEDVAIGLTGVDRADLVVVNPPRKGCGAAVLTQVARLSPRAIAYLSCDPDTLARDLAWLAARGYVTRSATPFDMLPHTPHVESLAIVEPS